MVACDYYHVRLQKRELMRTCNKHVSGANKITLLIRLSYKPS